MSDRSYDPLYFDQSFLTRLALVPLDALGRPQGDEQVRLLFKTSDPRGPTASIWIDLKVDPATLAAVPLPASGLLLLVGMGVMALFRGWKFSRIA
ncbi:MAG: VPLPA-CTERM sorting domain-containing protein [Pseudomonadota bacterium]